MKSRTRGVSICGLLYVLLIAVFLCSLESPLWAGQPGKGPSSSDPLQRAFDTPQEAATALIHAAETYDVRGPDSQNIAQKIDRYNPDKTVVVAAYSAKSFVS